MCTCVDALFALAASSTWHEEKECCFSSGNLFGINEKYLLQTCGKLTFLLIVKEFADKTWQKSLVF